MPVDDAPDDTAEETAPLTDLPCRNCGDDTPGAFCRACGQKKALHTGSLREVIQHALEDQLSLATALPRTARGLFLTPGFLTKEYVDGRIVRYIPPLRLYLLASVLFFLALSVFGQSRQLIRVNHGSPADTAAVRKERRARPPVTATWKPGGGVMHTGFEAFDTRFNHNIRQLDSLDATSAAQFLNRGVVQRGPAVMFLLVPFYALLFTLFYWRSRVYYAQHFVHALHIHSFAFGILALMLITPIGRIGLVINLALLGWLLLYLYLAQKQVYGQGWILTGVKYVSIGFIYLLAWAAGLLLSLVIAVTLM